MCLCVWVSACVCLRCHSTTIHFKKVASFHSLPPRWWPPSCCGFRRSSTSTQYFQPALVPWCGELPHGAVSPRPTTALDLPHRSPSWPTEKLKQRILLSISTLLGFPPCRSNPWLHHQGWPLGGGARRTFIYASGRIWGLGNGMNQTSSVNTKPG